MWKSTKVFTAFLFMGHAFCEENVEDREKLLQSNVLNCLLKITTANLCKIGLKMRAGPCPSLHYPPHPRKVCLWHIFFALPVMSGPLPAELKLRENTVRDNVR